MQNKEGAAVDRIQIENLAVYCHHGVLQEENVLGQKFLVSLTMFTDTKTAGRRDELACSVDYGEVAHFVEQQMKGRTYRLIEAAAENLAEAVLCQFPLVDKVRIAIKKPWAPILLPLESVGVTIERGWTQVYLSLGSNIGDRKQHLERAVQCLKEDEKIRQVVVSDWLETKPYGMVEQDDFLNGAAGLQTLYTPEELLERLHEIERQGGRERTVHWGPRTIDLDVIFYGDRIVQTEELTIPHREMHLRQFVLEPLAQIAPWAVHPVLGQTVMELEEKVRENIK